MSKLEAISKDKCKYKFLWCRKFRLQNLSFSYCRAKFTLYDLPELLWLAMYLLEKCCFSHNTNRSQHAASLHELPDNWRWIPRITYMHEEVHGRQCTTVRDTRTIYRIKCYNKAGVSGQTGIAAKWFHMTSFESDLLCNRQSLVVLSPTGTHDKSLIVHIQLRDWRHEAPSLTVGRVSHKNHSPCLWICIRFQFSSSESLHSPGAGETCSSLHSVSLTFSRTGPSGLFWSRINFWNYKPFHFGRPTWVGHWPITRPLPTQGRSQKNVYIHPSLERDSNPRSQCSGGSRPTYVHIILIMSCCWKPYTSKCKYKSPLNQLVT